MSSPNAPTVDDVEPADPDVAPDRAYGTGKADEEPEPFIARHAVAFGIVVSMLIAGIALAVCN